MGYVTDAEAIEWQPWLISLAEQNRVVHRDEKWSAVDGPSDPKKILLGRLEALGPVFEDETNPLMLELEHSGAILRTRLEGRTAWCERRLLARIHRYTLEKLRREIEAVSAQEFLEYLACWQHVDPEYMLGRRGVAEVESARRLRSRRRRCGRRISRRDASKTTVASGSMS
jgi:ATP-dependent Lhr-like helicase